MFESGFHVAPFLSKFVVNFVTLMPQVNHCIMAFVEKLFSFLNLFIAGCCCNFLSNFDVLHFSHHQISLRLFWVSLILIRIDFDPSSGLVNKFILCCFFLSTIYFRRHGAMACQNAYRDQFLKKPDILLQQNTQPKQTN